MLKVINAPSKVDGSILLAVGCKHVEYVEPAQNRWIPRHDIREGKGIIKTCMI
jgi:hypothetical protein